LACSAAFTNPSRPQFAMLVMVLFGAGRAPRMPEKNEPSAPMRGAPCLTRKIGAHSFAFIAVRMSSARSSTIGPDTPAPIYNDCLPIQVHALPSVTVLTGYTT